MYKVDVTSVVGLPRFGGWSQVVSSFHIANHLVCAFSIKGDHAGNVGRDLAAEMTQAQLNSVVELHQFITQLIQRTQKLDVGLQLACGLFSKNKVYLGAVNGSVFLKRGERAGTLLNSQAQIKLIEGKRVADEVVVLVTAHATSFLAEIEQKFASGFETDSIVTSIIPGLHGWDDSSLASLAFVAGGQELESQLDEIKKHPLPVRTQTKKKNFLNIPPALLLRGAGKKRQLETVKPKSVGQTTQVEAQVDQGLGELGRTRLTQSASSMRLRLNSIFIRLGGLLAAVMARVKRTNYRPVMTKIRELAARVKRTLTKLFIHLVMVLRKLISREVYLEPAAQQQFRRKLLPVILVIVVGGGLLMGQLLKVRRQVRSAQAALEPLLVQLETAKNQVSVEPLAARESVGQTVVALEQLQQDFTGQKKALQLIATTLTSAQTLQTQISGQEELNQLEIFYDLRLVEAQFVAAAVDADSKRAIFMDAERKKLVSLNLTNKQAQLLELNELENLRDLELSDTAITLLANGVRQQNTADQSELAEIIPLGDSNRAATLVESFGIYIYVFNPQKRNIYRYARQDEGYSNPIGWVSGAVSFDYDQVNSWAIDGDVWLTTRDGQIHKLASGREQEFKVTGLEPEFQQPLQVFTNENLENLYILEPDARRLVILDKQGEFIKEIKSDSLASTTMLFASEELHKAFGVSGSIVYSLQL